MQIREGRSVARDKECEDAQRRWIAGKFVNEVITSDVQAVVEDSDEDVKFDQEALIAGMKNSLTGEVRNVGGSSNVSKESLVGASAVNAVTEKSVREMQSTVKTIVAHIEWVYGATSGPESAISTWTMEIVGHVVSRSQSIVPDVRACDVSAEGGGAAAKRRSSSLSGMFGTMDKAKYKSETKNCTDRTRYLVDRFDGVVVGTTG